MPQKELFFKALERHLGPQSTYSLKPQLLDSFGRLYVFFTHPKTSDDKRHLIASRIADNVNQCTPGFHNQVSYLISLFNMPENHDELIAQVRVKLVDRIARIIASNNTHGIHVHNRVIEVARNAGFGVWPINTGDPYSLVGSSNLSDADIVLKLQTGFANHFQLFALVNALRDELEALIAPHGYQGKYDLEHEYKKEEYENYFECFSRFIQIEMGELLELEEKSGKIITINWQNVKRALLQKLREEEYVTLSHEEEALLDSLLLDKSMLSDSEPLSTLIPHGYELVQCLVFFSLWSMEQKATLVSAYLKNKTPEEQKEVLAILSDEAPQLLAELKKEPSFQAIYFAIAIAEKEIASVRAYIEAGSDINEAISLLFSPAHKSDTLFWLHDNPLLLQRLTVDGMNGFIPEGKYQGKTVAETLVSTKKGRQLFLENDVLKKLIAQTTLAHRLSDILKQAETERVSVNSPLGFFKMPNAKTVELVQLIVYGDLTKTEELLKLNPRLVKTLLTEKVTVTDYSRRKVKNKTAFQAALCAMDYELCEMLARYMSKEEMTSQYQAIFPEGDKKHYQAQTPFDFSQIITAISQSSDDDVIIALNLDLPNETVLWRTFEQFRADFTQHSSKEAVFNPQHLLRAFELYRSEFDNWSWDQRNLFWCQVVGYVQRFLPANIAMDFTQGIHFRAMHQDAAARSFKFRLGGDAIFPPAFNSFSGLGFEYAADDGITGWSNCESGGSVGLVMELRDKFKTYLEQKQESWENYADRVDPRPSWENYAARVDLQPSRPLCVIL